MDFGQHERLLTVKGILHKMDKLTNREKLFIIGFVSYCVFLKREKLIDLSIIMLSKLNRIISKVISKRHVSIDDATLHDFVNPNKKVKITKDDLINGIKTGNDIYNRMKPKKSNFPFRSNSPFLK